MQFPELKDWQSTSWSLHQASMLLGPIQNALLAFRNNYLHMPMFVEPTGLVSQTLPQGGVIHVNYKDAVVVYEPAGKEAVRLDLTAHTQASLFEALLTALKADEMAAFFEGTTGDTLAAALLGKLHSDDSYTEFLQLEDVTNEDPLSINAQTASDYADVLYIVYTAVSRFRARLEGAMTPVVVWAEHFDLSTLWFPPTNAGMDAHQPHINIGFAPYTPDLFEQPYIYAYAYPYPDPFTPPALPDPAVWSLEGFKGVVIHYEELQKLDDPEQSIEAVCAEIFSVLQGII